MTTTDEKRTAAEQVLRHAFAAGLLDFAGFTDRVFKARSGPASDISRAVRGLPEPGARPGGTHRDYPLDLDLLGQLAAIRDPRARLLRAAEIANQTAEDQETARVRRIRALITAHVRFGVKQVRCYEPYGILRRPYRAAVRRAAADLPEYGMDEAEASRAATANSLGFASFDALVAEHGADSRTVKLARAAANDAGAAVAFAEADKWHESYEAARSSGGTARLVRDVLIKRLTDEQVVSNAWVADVTGFSTARVAQIRDEIGRKQIAA